MNCLSKAMYRFHSDSETCSMYYINTPTLYEFELFSTYSIDNLNLTSITKANIIVAQFLCLVLNKTCPDCSINLYW